MINIQRKIKRWKKIDRKKYEQIEKDQWKEKRENDQEIKKD